MYNLTIFDVHLNYYIYIGTIEYKKIGRYSGYLFSYAYVLRMYTYNETVLNCPLNYIRCISLSLYSILYI